MLPQRFECLSRWLRLLIVIATSRGWQSLASVRIIDMDRRRKSPLPKTHWEGIAQGRRTTVKGQTTSPCRHPYAMSACSGDTAVRRADEVTGSLRTRYRIH
ncbi:hypothetical protein KC333_g101 [Hortaea werneckii]|nr:hypothetical protein KC333_g101 [Hortaea werneckii]